MEPLVTIVVASVKTEEMVEEVVPDIEDKDVAPLSEIVPVGDAPVLVTLSDGLSGNDAVTVSTTVAELLEPVAEICVVSVVRDTVETVFSVMITTEEALDAVVASVRDSDPEVRGKERVVFPLSVYVEMVETVEEADGVATVPVISEV